MLGDDIPNHYHVWHLFLEGFALPLVVAQVAFFVVIITKHTGMLVPYLFLGLILTWLSIYILRAVVRLNKKLDRHEASKDAHK